MLPPKRTKENLIGLARSSIKNQLHSLVDSIVKPPPEYNMHGLVDENRLKWIWKNLGHLGNTHYQYQRYSKPEINNGIFKIDNDAGQETTIALLSDWATDTLESRNIATLVGQTDYSIHLGDTYYVGNSDEIGRNFNNTYDGHFPYGTRGSFAMLGNHEMYSSGKPYFTELLPYMGVYTGIDTRQQEASFFCLENDFWRIIGLDTGYDSIKGWLGLKPNLSLQLHNWQMQWLNETVKPGNDNRGLIFLSHHQFISAFEDEYPTPARQIAQILKPDKTILWLWGHEHRLSVYGNNKLANGLNCFSRCIGQSGMPIEIGKLPKSEKWDDAICRNLVLYDERQREIIDKKIRLGYNGFAKLRLNQSSLVIEYFDDNDSNPTTPRKIMEEKWSIDVATGKMTGNHFKDFTEGSEKKITHFVNDITSAYKTE